MPDRYNIRLSGYEDMANQTLWLHPVRRVCLGLSQEVPDNAAELYDSKREEDGSVIYAGAKAYRTSASREEPRYKRVIQFREKTYA